MSLKEYFKQNWKDMKQTRAENKAWVKEHGWFYPKRDRDPRIGQLTNKAIMCFAVSGWVYAMAIASHAVYLEHHNADAHFIEDGFAFTALALVVLGYVYLLRSTKMSNEEKKKRKAQQRLPEA